MFETCRNSRKLFHIIKVLNVATVDALGVIISIRGVSFHGKDYHIGVASNVVCSTLIGNARASMRGMDNRTVHAFFMSLCETKFSRGLSIRKSSIMKFDGTISKGGDAPPCIGLIPSVLP